MLSGRLEGCDPTSGARLEIRLFEPEKRIEFHWLLRKLPVPEPEAVYVAFPFAPADAQIAYEAQGGLVRPGADQLAGSSSDWQTVQNFLTLRHPQGQIIWGSAGAPLVQLGEFNLGKWQPVTHVAQPHVYSWVMNNYWFTNFRLTQEGEFRWSYFLTSTRDAGNAAATRLGWSARLPLATRVLPPLKSGQSTAPPALSLVTIDVPERGGGGHPAGRRRRRDAASARSGRATRDARPAQCEDVASHRRRSGSQRAGCSHPTACRDARNAAVRRPVCPPAVLRALHDAEIQGSFRL